MDEDFCDNELYDDMMEAYAQGFVLCYGGVCDTEGDGEIHPVSEKYDIKKILTPKKVVVHVF